VSDYQRYEGQRASTWITSRVGKEGYDRVWGPLLRAKFGAYADDVSMVWFWGKIYLRFASRQGGLFAKEQLGYLRGSFGRLVDALIASLTASGAELANGAPVERILTEGGRVTGVKLADGREVPADMVIATVPSQYFQRMLPELPALDPAYDALLGQVRYQWATVLVLALDRPLSDIY